MSSREFAASVSVVATMAYLYLLSQRLKTPHPKLLKSAEERVFTPEEFNKVTYKDIDLLASIPSTPTREGYVIVGGSGFIGQYVGLHFLVVFSLIFCRYIVRLLVLRGETNIRMVDLRPPSDESLLKYPGVSFAQANIASLHHLRDAVVAPFPGTGRLPTVIFHTAAVIRFYERCSYSYWATASVNVLGTQNVIKVAKELPGAILIYTSTCDVACPRSRYLRLGYDLKSSPRDNPIISDYSPRIPLEDVPSSNYTRSKRIAEEMVLHEHRKDGLKTGAVRPGL